MVNVYIWAPHLKGPSYHGEHIYVGHAAMFVDGGSPPGHVYISWWPAVRGSGVISRAGVKPLIHKTLQEDTSTEGRPPDRGIAISGLDESKIKAFWASWALHGQYQLNHANCATTVAHALSVGGGSLYAHHWKHTKWLPWLPHAVGQYADAINAEQAALRAAR